MIFSLFLLFLGFLALPFGCKREIQDLPKLKVRDRTLVCNWIAEGLFSTENLPFSLSSSPALLQRGDFWGGREEEIVFYSANLPNVYILSPTLSLLKKLPFSSSRPKIFSFLEKDFLTLTNGKEIFFFVKGERGSLTRRYRLRLADSFWLKDFFVTEQEGKMRVWTLERKGEESFLFSYSLPEGKIISQEKLSAGRFLGGGEGTLFILGERKIYARGRNNWDQELGFNDFMAQGFCRTDGKTLFLLLFDPTNKKSQLLTYQTEDGKELERKGLGGNGIFFNDFSLCDFDNDGEKEKVLTYSGREGGILVMKGEKVLWRKRFAPSLSYHRVIVYLLGIFETDEGTEIMVNLILEKEKGRREDWFYRLSPQLRTREASDLEDVVYACLPLGNGFLTVGEGLAIYQWE
ncbi:MAG: hypothetical protein ABIK97_01955 [candidate division WOR-3 bacterium]